MCCLDNKKIQSNNNLKNIVEENYYRYRSISSILIKAPFNAIKDFPGGTILWFASTSSLIDSLSYK